MKNKSPLYVIAIVTSIISLLVANLIISLLNYQKALTTADLEDAIHNILFIE